MQYDNIISWILTLMLLIILLNINERGDVNQDEPSLITMSFEVVQVCLCTKRLDKT